MTSPTLANRSSAITNSALRALRIAVTPTPVSPASCEIGAKVASPTPRPEHHDVLPGWIDRKADPERSDHVELVADFQRRKAVGAAADAFVEKLDAAGSARSIR